MDEIKKVKKFKRSRLQTVKMLFTIKGVKKLCNFSFFITLDADFKTNWGKMVG